jgi:flagellin
MLSAYSNGFVINTNMASLIVQKNLANATNDMTTLMERLSTGLKINRASDDPSGMALSNYLQKQVSSTNIAMTNSQTGTSLLQTAEGDLKTIQSNLSKMKDLITQAKTGTTSDAQRAAYNATFQQYLSEIDRIATSSNYSGIKLLDGSNSAVGKIVLQIDINNDASSKLDISSALASASNSGLGGIGSTAIDTVAGATSAESMIESAYNQVTTQVAKVGGFVTRLDSNVTRLKTRNENMQSAKSLLTDADTAADTAALTKAEILQQTSTALLQQANSSASLILTLIGATG